MKEIVFVDIDTQVDFIMPEGRLYVQGAQTLIPRLKQLTEIASHNGIPIISSLDSHIKNDPEFKQFPPHCVVGSPGQKKIPEVLLRRQIVIPQKILNKKELLNKIKGYAQLIVQKNTYDIFVNMNLLQLLKSFTTAFVYGVALDYCVKYAVVGLLQRGLNVYIVSDAVKPVDPSEGRRLLSKFAHNGVVLIKAKQVVSEIRRLLQ